MKRTLLLLFLFITSVLGYSKVSVEELKDGKWECVRQDTSQVSYELNVDNIRVCYLQDTVNYHIYSLVSSERTGAGCITIYYCGECLVKFVSNINTHHMLYIEYTDKRITIY